MTVGTSFWKAMSLFWFFATVVSLCLLFGVFDLPAFKPGPTGSAAKDDGFQSFESIAFAREFSERYQTFDSRTFKISQIATAFLLDDETRARRLGEIERLEDKIVRLEVTQRARVMTLLKMPGQRERFRADLFIELVEGPGSKAVRSEFVTRLEFSLERVDRSAQNSWGFRVSGLTQEVVPGPVDDLTGGTAPSFALRPGMAMLLRFPCSIENVELPKGTTVRVKLTTLDISELQMKTEAPLADEQIIRAICRDRKFTMKVVGESEGASMADALVVLKTLTMDNSTPISTLSGTAPKPKRKKLGVEKSIEEQLGFIVEE